MSARSRTSRGARVRARRRRRWRRTVLLVLALGVTAAVVYTGTRLGKQDPGAEPAPGPASPSESATPPAQVDLSALPIDRGPFCDRVDPGDVEDALGGPVASTYHYGNGDRRRIAPGVTDVSHEYNCTFAAADGTQARVWVFAQPVTRAVGASIARQARREKGCDPVPSAPTFGTPTAATVCRERKPVRTAVTLRGLFGDAWMSCELSTPGSSTDETVQRTEQLCVRVATTLGARP
jgi:hypothetical protein